MANSAAISPIGDERAAIGEDPQRDGVDLADEQAQQGVARNGGDGAQRAQQGGHEQARSRKRQAPANRPHGRDHLNALPDTRRSPGRFPGLAVARAP